MKKIVYIFIIALICVGCDDFLKTNPTNRASLSTPDDVAALLVTAYPVFNHVWFCEVRSDNATDIGPAAPVDDITRKQLYYWEDVEASIQDTPEGFFYQSYVAIASANHALAAIDEIVQNGNYSEEELSPYRGEALIARAYNHFMVANLFVEHYDPATASSTLAIPYVTTVEESPIVVYERLSLQQVYDMIEKDIIEGFPLISDDAYRQPKWHFNKRAAATFISNYYLYRGLPTDWDKVIEYANIALGDRPQSFLRDWSNAADQSFDAFGTEYSRSTNPANFLITSTISTLYRSWYYRYTMDNDLSRTRFTYVSPHPVSASSSNFDYFLRYKAAGNSTTGCYNIFKYNEVFKRDGVNANFGLPYIMYTPVVAEEALFNLMEAYTMKENYNKVLELFNIYYSVRVKDYNSLTHRVTDANITRKYGPNAESFPVINPHFSMSEKQETYLRCIVNVRASEFAGEGRRWFDIKRMHIEVVHKVYPNSEIRLYPNDQRRPFAIPADALQYMTSSSSSDKYELVKSTKLYPEVNLEGIKVNYNK